MFPDRETLWRVLNFVHSTMVAAEPLLSMAISRSEGRLKEYFRRHLEEEKGHADWLARDLARLGDPPALNGSGALVAGLQYYLIIHLGPEALLGYMRVLESRPMPLEDVAALEEAYGDLGCLRHHAENDPQHAKDIAAEIDALSDDRKGIASLSADWTMMLMEQELKTLSGSADHAGSQ